MFARHDLVWLSAEGWRQALAGVSAGAAAIALAGTHARAQTALAAWQEAGWPAVVRRADADQAPGQVCIGVPLPPRPEDGRKLRVAGRVDADAIVRHRLPLPLAQAAAQEVHAPPAWRPALSRLAQPVAEAIRTGAHVRPA